MSLKGRRFSLDPALMDRSYGGKKSSSSSRGSSKKSRVSQSLDDAQLEIQDTNPNLNSSLSLSKHTIVKENLEPSDGLVKNNSLKHNKTFHKLFPETPEEETVMHTFTCSLQKEVLYHGKLYVSENYLCFHSSVLLKDTKVVIPASSVTQVNKLYLSMVSVRTADEEKYTFVSLRNREFTYDLIKTRCSHAQEESANSSPQLSSAEIEADQDVASGHSSLEDSFDHDGSRQSSIDLPGDFSHLSAERERTGPRTHSADPQRGFTDEVDGASTWIWRTVERLSPSFLHRQIRNPSFFFYLNMLLVLLLLLTSWFIGLRIIALQEQLESLQALAAEVSVLYKEYQDT